MTKKKPCQDCKNIWQVKINKYINKIFLHMFTGSLSLSHCSMLQQFSPIFFIIMFFFLCLIFPMSINVLLFLPSQKFTQPCAHFLKCLQNLIPSPASNLWWNVTFSRRLFFITLFVTHPHSPLHLSCIYVFLIAFIIF